MPYAMEDWVKTHVESQGFRVSQMPGPYRVVILKAGRQASESRSQANPVVLDAIQSAFSPYPGCRMRLGSDFYIVTGVEFRSDLDCLVALVHENTVTHSMPRYFTDGVDAHI